MRQRTKSSDVAKTTSARQLESATLLLLQQLMRLHREATERAWAIGDLVNKLKGRGISVTEQARSIGASRQRLSELRQTALAFPVDHRPEDVDVHFCTIAMRSARRLGLSAPNVVRVLQRNGIESSREATRFLAQRQRQKEALRAAARTASSYVPNQVLDRPHHGSFQEVLPRLKAGSVKLILADPPYGTYGTYRNGKHNRVSAGQLDCDHLEDASAQQQHADLFELTAPKMAQGGCMVIFRPGGLADPLWLLRSADQYGWECRHAVTWRRGPGKLGDGRSPYTSATERLLVFARNNDALENHDGSSTADVYEVKLPRQSYADANRHLFGKPMELMEKLICKHSHPGEMVIEPFGGSGPVSRAAIRLGRRWLYCESNLANHALGSRLIAEQLEAAATAAG